MIGRVERIDLPDWELLNLDAKIDTGAFSSSLHCHHIEVFERNEAKWVRFHLLDPEYNSYNERLMEFPVSDQRVVKSSNGIGEERIFIETVIMLYNQKFNIELSLSNRAEMKYPILLGRKFLAKKFVVDVSRTYLSEKHALKERRTS